MQLFDAQHHGSGDATPGDRWDGGDGGQRAAATRYERAMRSVVPQATCVFAFALWCGAASAGGSRWAEVGWARCAEAMIAPCAAATIVCAVGAVMLAFVAQRTSAGGRGLAVALALLAACGFGLGATLRFDESLDAAQRPVLIVPTDGRLARIEATVVAPFVERGFAVDLLARYLVKPMKFLGFVRDVVFIAEDGTRHAVGDKDALLAVAVFDRPPACKVADRVAFVGTLRGDGGGGLPGDARMSEAAARRGVVGSVAVDDPALVRVIADEARSTPLLDACARLREAVRGRLRDALLDGVPEDRGFAVRSMLVALVLGDAEDGYRTVENSFRAVGLSHILAISGFNLAVLGWVVGLAARAVSANARVQAIACGAAALGALVLMAPAASAVRSALMAVVGASGSALGREWNGDAVLAIAAAAMVVATPSDALNPGFQLSFACVLALRHLAIPIQTQWLAWLPTDDARRGHPAWLGIAGEVAARAFGAGLAAFLASTPIVLVHFGSLQPFGTLLTLLCGPLSTATLAVAYPKAMLGAIWPPFSWFATWLLAWPMWLAAYAQIGLVELALRFGAGSVAMGQANWMLGAAMVVLLCIALRDSKRWRRSLAWTALAVACAVHAFGATRGRTPPHFECTMFAIGDGTTVAIESGDTVALFDGGSSSIGNVASRVLLPWIDARGGRVDAAFISHPDLDHLSALEDVARYARVGHVYFHPSLADAARVNPAIAELFESLRARGVAMTPVAAGDVVRIGASNWHVLWPTVEFRSRRDNDMSLVIRIEVDATEARSVPRLLLSGDIETEPAARLSSMHMRDACDLSCDILEIPHHGSWREAVVGYIDCARPQVILQSTADRRFRQDRFAPHLAAGTARLVTCRDGSIRIACGPDGSINASVVDESAEGGMRPVGRWTARNRPRRLRRRRASFRRAPGSGSTLSDEAPAVNRDAVAGDSVAAVPEDDLERCVGCCTPFDAHLHASSGHIEDDLLRRGLSEADRDGRACIGGDRFDERELCGEDEVRRRIGEPDRERESRCDGTVKLDRSKPEHRLVGRINSYLRRCLVAIRTGRRAVLRRAARDQRRDGGGIEENRGRSCCTLSELLRSRVAGEKRVGEREPPARRGLVPDLARSDDRAVIGPDERRGRTRFLKCGERDSGDSLELHPTASRGRLGLRLRGRVALWLIRILHRIGQSAAGCRSRLERDFLAERVDETGRRVTVREEDGVSVRPRGCAPRCGEPNLGDRVGLDRDHADPAMLPSRSGAVGMKCAGEELAIRENQRSSSELREERHRAPLGGADDASDGCGSCDFSGRKRGGGVGRRKARGRAVERKQATVDPVPVAQEPLHTRRLGGRRGRRDCKGDTGAGKQGRGKKTRRGDASGAKVSELSGERVHRACHRRYRLVLALEDGKVALRHLKHDQRHRGSVGVALGIGPRAIGVLFREKLFANRRPPGLPAFATREVHRLHGVIVTVEVVGLGETACDSAAAARERILLEIVESALDGLVLVDAGVKEARDARRSPRPRGSTEILHVSEAAIGVLTRPDITNRIVDRRLRHLDAGVARAAKRYHLADRHRNVGVVGNRVVPPATFVILGSDDELDGSDERVANPVVLLVHAVDLAQEQRRKTMPIHRAMSLVGDKQTRLGRVLEHKTKRLLNRLREVAASREVSVRHHRDRAKARHAHVVSKATLAEGAIGLLLPAQVLESLAHSLLKSRGDLRLARRVLGADLSTNGGTSGRRGRAGLCWVRGHWRRRSGASDRGRRRDLLPLRARGSQHATGSIAISAVMVVVSSIEWVVKPRYLGCGQHHDDATVETQCPPAARRRTLDRLTRGPPDRRGLCRREDRCVGDEREAARGEQDTRWGEDAVHFEASSASLR
jgi:ComEC/Rec2-related protein